MQDYKLNIKQICIYSTQKSKEQKEQRDPNNLNPWLKHIRHEHEYLFDENYANYDGKCIEM